MKALFSQLSSRERMLIAAGMILIVAAALYAFIYQPLVVAVQQLKIAVDSQQTLNRSLRGISKEIRALPADPSTLATVTDAGQSLIGSIDSSSEDAGIKPAIRRLAPEAQNQATLWIEQAPADLLLHWLIGLEHDHAIAVQQATISRDLDNSELVSGKISMMQQINQ